VGALATLPSIRAQQQDPFSADTKRSYETIRGMLRKAVEDMPDKKYGFRPTAAVPTYGEIIAHIADLQTKMCGLAKGEENDGNPNVKKTKANLRAALETSFTYCDAVYSGMTDAEGYRTVDLFGQAITRLALLNGNIAYDNRMYGAMVTYLQMNGITPSPGAKVP